MGMIFSKVAVDSGYYCFLFEAAWTEIRASRAVALFGRSIKAVHSA
jgi:Pyruvate/2-oxoacid:ferredoxin oxidoreductase gamma subunit